MTWGGPIGAPIQSRHSIQTGQKAGLAISLVRVAIDEIGDSASDAIARLESELPAGFPKRIHVAVKDAVTVRLRSLNSGG